jgi:hypothetical protein
MPLPRYDPASKWLLHHQGKGALLVGGLKGVRRYEPMPGEIVQSRKYPDGLLRVFLEGDKKPHHVLVEVATYSEKRARKQALDDLALAYCALGHLPELLMLVLHPKGKVQIGGKHEIRSKLGLSWLGAGWRPVELWTLSAEEFLAEGDAGVAPWTVLMRFDGQPETLLERCAAKIEREAHPEDRDDLLAVTQVLGGLRFPESLLMEFLGGEQHMFESPVLQRFVARRFHEGILDVLKDRFGTVPQNVTKPLREIIDEKKLRKLNVLAAKCPDLKAFHEALLA